MAESYIPQNTLSICTNMTKPSPQKLLILRGNPRTFTHVSGDREAVLNANDRNLSDAFTCKNQLKFWGGLEALCAGLAVAALVVATVATGGLALAATAVVVGACAVGIGAGIAGLVTMNECAKCLQQWQLIHSNVSIEGAKALLQDSFLSCSNGGVITIVLDPVVARDAAEKISRNNNEEVLWQMGSQFLQGLIAIAANGNKYGGPAGLVVAAVLQPIDYVRSENKNESDRTKQLDDIFTKKVPYQQTSIGNQIGESAENFGKYDAAPTLGAGAADAATVTTTVTHTSVAAATASEATAVSVGGVTVVSASEASAVSASQVTVTATTKITQMETQATVEAASVTAVSASRTTAVIVGDAATDGVTMVTARSASITAEESLEIATRAGFNGGTFAKGLGIGLLGAAVNIGIDTGSGIKEDKLYKATIEEALSMRDKNADFLNQSKIKVIADRK